MLGIHELFEAHLTVRDLNRAMDFYGGSLGLELAAAFPERRVAFYWLGGRGRTMLGIWETGAAPLRVANHVAFRVELNDLLAMPARLRGEGIEPLDFDLKPADEPVVLTWMPAGSLYFQDPDGNLLEFLTMLDARPRPELGVVSWSQWSSPAP